MKYYSTNNRSHRVSFSHAVQQGLAPDGGLYMPETIPVFSNAVIEALHTMSFEEMAYHALIPYTSDDLSETELRGIIERALIMDAPLVPLQSATSRAHTFAMEQFHGPTLAFKDFGGRFMAQFLSVFRRGASRDLTILVATSGDTGSAVAQGFYGIEGIHVCILYPSGKVSAVQEQQLTTIGGNVRAVEIQGSFDDCQALVKRAFNDPLLMQSREYTSANSINIARLLPQMLYYVRAIGFLQQQFAQTVFITPSGNFGNITAGLLTKMMGLPISKFIAAVNRNDVFPMYLHTGEFRAKPSVQTPSNAMDVGNPSNFARMMELFHHDVIATRRSLDSYSIPDEDTFQAIRDVYAQYGYVIDPHGAVGYRALERYFESHRIDPETAYVILETAHPAKFGDVVMQALGIMPAMPERLRVCMDKPKHSVILPNDYQLFREYLMQESS